MRRHELMANVTFQLPFFVMVGLVLVTLWPVNVLVMLALYACGLIDLVYAKLSLSRGEDDELLPEHL